MTLLVNNIEQVVSENDIAEKVKSISKSRFERNVVWGVKELKKILPGGKIRDINFQIGIWAGISKETVARIYKKYNRETL